MLSCGITNHDEGGARRGGVKIYIWLSGEHDNGSNYVRYFIVEIFEGLEEPNRRNGKTEASTGTVRNLHIVKWNQVSCEMEQLKLKE